MFIVSPSTIWNRNALETRQVPRRIFGRVMLLPRRGFPLRLVWRMAFETQMLRFLGVLAPFVAAMFVWRQSALAIAQAPLPDDRGHPLCRDERAAHPGRKGERR